LKLLLKQASTLRRLALVLPVENERCCQVVSVCHVEQSRPELVVLAFGEVGVVAQRVSLEGVTLDENRRVEKGCAEECSPANGGRTSWHHVRHADLPGFAELHDARAAPDPPTATRTARIAR
jgi:hypothetical protein